jgi:hypothetical protein
MPEAEAAAIVTWLAAVGLLDQVDGGYFAPHNWHGRQGRRSRSRGGIPTVTPP